MIRADLFRAVEFAHAAAHNATLAASYDKIDPVKAEKYRRLSEDAFYAGIEALFESDLTPPKAKGQAMSRPVEEMAA